MSKEPPNPEPKQYQQGANPNAPALVCIIEARGYEKDNVMVVSQRSAALIEHLRKVSATAAELRGLAYFFDLAAAEQQPRKVRSERTTTLIEHAREVNATADELRALASFFDLAAAKQHPGMPSP